MFQIRAADAIRGHTGPQNVEKLTKANNMSNGAVFFNAEKKILNRNSFPFKAKALDWWPKFSFLLGTKQL